MKKNFINSMLKDRAEHTPKKGFNVIGIDTFELPGEQLYLVKHFNTLKEAQEFVKNNKGSDDLVIYGAEK